MTQLRFSRFVVWPLITKANGIDKWTTGFSKKIAIDGVALIFAIYCRDRFRVNHSLSGKFHAFVGFLAPLPAICHFLTVESPIFAKIFLLV